MTAPPGERGVVVEWASAGAALAGEVESGDVHVVAPFPGGALVAVVDGLGHGPEAAAASRAAAALLAARPSDPVADLVRRCHEALRATRGAVMSVASFRAEAASLTWVGVGNVEAVLLRAAAGAAPRRESMTPRAGIVGYQLPPLRPAALPVGPGDTLVMVTDGLRSGFVAALDGALAPQELADALLAGYARGSDDALAVVARYRGGAP